MGWSFTFTESMREAGLTGNELVVMAVIHCYSQKKQGVFFGKRDFLADVCGCTPRTIANILASLEERGLISKGTGAFEGHLRCCYYSTLDDHIPARMKNFHSNEKISSGDGKNFIRPNEKISSIKENININFNEKEGSLSNAPARGKFDFRGALLELGVTPETADAWMEVRRRAKAVNSELAFKDVAAQIAKSGHSAEECIHKAAAKSWRGFEAAWMEERQPAQQRQQPRKQENYFEANARVAEQIRRDLFKESQPYDEQ